jgi:hypothetical protein
MRCLYLDKEHIKGQHRVIRACSAGQEGVGRGICQCLRHKQAHRCLRTCGQQSIGSPSQTAVLVSPGHVSGINACAAKPGCSLSTPQGKAIALYASTESLLHLLGSSNTSSQLV